ncbi:MAG TPA: helix-hairpin-helix domain-containing protein [bacterium]|nr:helix-hairpin-helix domain-containing protein [bacterium]
MNNNRKLLWIILLAAIAGTVIFLKNNDYFNSGNEENPYSEELKNETSDETLTNNYMSVPEKRLENSITIGISGAVKNPGSYVIDKPVSIRELINLAGGLNQDADYDFKYDNVRIFESDTVVIPAKLNYDKYQNKFTLTNQSLGNLDRFEKKEKDVKSKIYRENASLKKININSDNISELTQIPRIGPKTAETIIEYRKEHGNFKNINELTKVPRIGPKTFELIKEKITVK